MILVKLHLLSSKENPFNNLPNIYYEQVDNFDGFVCSGIVPYSELIINIKDIKVPLNF